MDRLKKCCTLALFISLFTSHALGDDKIDLKMCAFTIMGANGPDIEIIKDYQLAALKWGVNIEIKPYFNEQVIENELKSGACDIASMTGSKAHQFNRFTGSIGAVGAIPDYQHLNILLATLNKSKAKEYMTENGYEVIGIQPAGAIYLFLEDRYLKGIADLAGRKIGVLDNFKEIHQMVTDLGMNPVSSTVSNMYQKFNNGVIDIVGGPAIVYEVMELHKGLKDTGGVIEAPLLQSTIQIIARADKLPPGFAEKSRDYIFNNYSDSIDFITAVESKIPRKYWIPVPDCNMAEFDAHNKKVRLSFKEKGVYHPKMLTLLRKIRCKVDATRAECTDENAE